MDGILALADSAPDMEEASYEISYKTQEPVRIGVACDEAFCFFYEDNFRILKEMGAELIYFSPVHDSCLPKDLGRTPSIWGIPGIKWKSS